MDDIAEKEIVGRGLLGVFGPLIVRVVANESGAYTHDLLQSCATMALAKFMSISNSFCEKQLPLLLTSLSKNKSSDTTLRANLVIALGDLAFRFPNTFEPYTAHLYSNLADPSPTVKRHSMSVLSHLILNDMIKIKGNVASVAMLIVSKDQTLSDMSKLLFNELSKRSNNPVYNLIPDVVSLLSTDAKVSRSDFKNIMSFLLSFMTKDKLSDALVDKLMKRFETAASINVKRDLALCLSLLKTTEKSVKTLNDGFKVYKDCLVDSEIFGHFAAILKKGKSFASPNLKQTLEELEKKMNEENSHGMSNVNAAEKAERAKMRAAKRIKNQQERKKVLKAKKAQLEDLEEEEEEEDYIEYKPEKKDRRTVRESEEGEDNEVEEDDILNGGDENGGALGNLGKTTEGKKINKGYGGTGGRSRKKRLGY